MKTIIVTVGLIFTVVVMNAQDTLAGVYDTGKGNTKIEIKEQEGVCTGTVVSSDKLKPGTLMLKEITSVGGTWQGKLYSVKKKKWYDAVFREEDGQLLVTVDAGIAKRTVTWTKE